LLAFIPSRSQILQLLPITDTTCFWDERDSYPYSSISVVALHPMYLRIQAIKDLPANIKADADKETKRFNEPKYFTSPQMDTDLNVELHRPVDYPAMIQAKKALMQRAYDAIGQQVLASDDFQRFFKKSERWLRPYGVFCWLRDFFGTANHEEWGALGTGRVNYEKLLELSSPGSDLYKGVGFYWVMQYWLHLQLKEASNYCQSKGVALKGDLPIGIDHDSVDAWYEPHFFNMHKKTGAPPDDYAADGQNWGFPTYNWDEMEKDGFGWWRARLGAMEEYFHAYRIDHILGFFRIWEMPSSTTGGLLGKFSPALPLSMDELRQKGINDIDRLTNPYIKQHLLENVFRHDWRRVKDRYMDDAWGDSFRFKDGLNSEVELTKIVEREGSMLGYMDRKELLAGLRSFVNNVVLLRDDKNPNEAFHPRIEMWKSSSFNELGGDQQHKLRELYQSYFYERQDQFWAEQAMRKLPPLLDASKMLVCGEDLGMIPACVAGVLDKLVIMGLRIQRMPPPSANCGQFGRCDAYPYMSVATPSCHDMSTAAGWWEEDQGRRNHFWNEVCQRQGEAPHKYTPEVAMMLFKQHLWAPSCFAIFPIQDILALEDSLANQNARSDQINWPPNPQHYWRWRCKASMDEISRCNSLNDKIRALVNECGRNGGY
jgi:4-alpha-glucanotransferase